MTTEWDERPAYKIKMKRDEPHQGFYVIDVCGVQHLMQGANLSAAPAPISAYAPFPTLRPPRPRPKPAPYPDKRPVAKTEVRVSEPKPKVGFLRRLFNSFRMDDDFTNKRPKERW